MTFRLETRDLRPDFDLQEYIFAEGAIVAGTTEKFISFVASQNLTSGATVILNSPGGSPTEGMHFGEAIRALYFRTNVGAAMGQPMQIAPGECMSACIFPYLGGSYRYLERDSVLGVHQFRFTTDHSSTTTAIVSQTLSGKIVDYIIKSRAKPELFSLMSKNSTGRCLYHTT